MDSRQRDPNGENLSQLIPVEARRVLKDVPTEQTPDVEAYVRRDYHELKNGHIAVVEAKCEFLHELSPVEIEAMGADIMTEAPDVHYYVTLFADADADTPHAAYALEDGDAVTVSGMYELEGKDVASQDILMLLLSLNDFSRIPDPSRTGAFSYVAAQDALYDDYLEKSAGWHESVSDDEKTVIGEARMVAELLGQSYILKRMPDGGTWIFQSIKSDNPRILAPELALYKFDTLVMDDGTLLSKSHNVRIMSDGTTWLITIADVYNPEGNKRPQHEEYEFQEQIEIGEGLLDAILGLKPQINKQNRRLNKDEIVEFKEDLVKLLGAMRGQ